MQIPVFVSCATDLNSQQEKVRDHILTLLFKAHLSVHTLGKTDYPSASPLAEVFVLAQHCSGGLILGFEQAYSAKVLPKRGALRDGTPFKSLRDVSTPTPWNHLEAGILYGLQLPLLILREKGVGGGIFDSGTVDGFVHSMPRFDELSAEGPLEELVNRWQGKVQQHYYRPVQRDYYRP